jgi:hypothetical protein
MPLAGFGQVRGIAHDHGVRLRDVATTLGMTDSRAPKTVGEEAPLAMTAKSSRIFIETYC